MGGKVKSAIELKISCSDIILNDRFSQKFNLLKNDKFNYLSIMVTEISHDQNI